jgi:soluble lytic murein transglycosylase-like protein
MRLLLAAAIVLASASSAKSNESSAEFFAKDRGKQSVQTKAIPYKASASQAKAKEVIAQEVKKTIGAAWVSVALGQAKRESGFNPKAVGIRLGARHRHQRALGIFQVLPSTARGLGFDPNRLTDLEYGVKVGVAYMGECIKAGVKTPSQMNQCFLYGYHGWGRSNAKRRNNIKRSA